jgi:two-component system, NtrC family, response regulator PilR
MARILLIDDSPALLAHIEQMLADGGHDVFATADGNLAVKHLASAEIDLVLTDIYMPPPDGFEILQAVKALPRAVPLIVMSTNPLACDVFRAARAMGAAVALQKPFTAEHLLAAVREALNRGVAAPASARPAAA